MLFKLLISLILLGFSFSGFTQTSLGDVKEFFTVDTIVVEGSKKVEAEAILEKMTIKPKSVLDNYGLRKDIKKIYDMKYFDSVEAHHKVIGGKNQLIIKVKEKPTSQRTIFSCKKNSTSWEPQLQN